MFMFDKATAIKWAKENATRNASLIISDQFWADSKVKIRKQVIKKLNEHGILLFKLESDAGAILVHKNNPKLQYIKAGSEAGSAGGAIWTNNVAGEEHIMVLTELTY